MKVNRLPNNPIIYPGMCESIRDNINGPSLIRVPDWLPNPLGKYYLYFAHHSGKFIRLAYADDLAGPWTVYKPGSLPVGGSKFIRHIASPDVHVDHDAKQIRMYYHGPLPEDDRDYEHFWADYPYPKSQATRTALSSDGINFEPVGGVITPFYIRVFQYGGWYYGITMPCRFYRSRDGISDWQNGPHFFGEPVRHGAVRLVGDDLEFYYSQRYEIPEHIKMTRFNLDCDWMNWSHGESVSVLKPEHDWEGADCPDEPSASGAVHQRVKQVRDPAIYEEDGRVYLVYSIAGESGLAIAELSELD